MTLWTCKFRCKVHAFWSNGIYHAICFKLHLEGCHGSNLVNLVRETTTRWYLIPLRACSSVMPLLVAQPTLHSPPPFLPWCGSRPFPALVHLIPNSCWDRVTFLSDQSRVRDDPSSFFRIRYYLSMQGKQGHSYETMHSHYSMSQCTALHCVDT